MEDRNESLQDELHDSITKELGNFVTSKTATFACGGSIPIGTSPVDIPRIQEDAEDEMDEDAKGGTNEDHQPLFNRSGLSSTGTSRNSSSATTTTAAANSTATFSENKTNKQNNKDQKIPCLPVSLRWDSSSQLGVISKLSFPITSSEQDKDSDLHKLVNDCQPASFGYNGKDVLDESYRKAIKLDRSAFSIDFCPYETGIIDTVAQLLLPNAGVANKGVRAELYKLNVYNAPSGFFKPHVDTPRSGFQFGSLVVALPCHHEGGELIVRHAGQTITFDWSKSGSRGRNDSAIQWAAFYSDCEHEVKEVTEGHRVTVTYNLYYTAGVGDFTGKSPVMDVTSLLFYHKIKAALEIPGFMTKGGTLGIYCQHAYAHSTSEGIRALPGALKGTDMAVYSVFLALGLNISIRPVLELDEEELMGYYDDELEDKHFPENNFVASKLKPLVVSDVGGDGSDIVETIESFGGEWLDVNWLNSAKHENIGFVHLKYGNQAETTYTYTHAAFIITVRPAHLRVDLTSHS